MSIKSEMNALLDKSSVSKWGFATLRGNHDLGDSYPTALSLILSYQKPDGEYDVEKYHSVLIEKRKRLDLIVEEIVRYLEGAGIGYKTIPHQQNPNTLEAEFPHKLAASLAGLGWIGKSSLLITPEFGPRVRLSTVLIARDLGEVNKVNQCRCGQCDICVKACPYGYINNALWHPGMNRENLFSPFECSAKRAEFINTIGYKHECGFCLLECPVGS